MEMNFIATGEVTMTEDQHHGDVYEKAEKEVGAQLEQYEILEYSQELHKENGRHYYEWRLEGRVL